MTMLPSPAFAATCGQPTHVWIATPAGSLANGNTVTLPVGTATYQTGVVSPGTSITFNGANFANSVTTTTADGNCVVHHQDNIMYIGYPTGTWPIYATYILWETGIRQTTLVGYINVVA
ncbi:MAG TPA: hypothetical protein VEO01_25750 [Pseudonocardiaceae bacterium]|nr:hypothetical protein [Pseudonocardiaceae bacterium]